METAAPSDSPRKLLRHAVAVVAYRGSKVLRGAPAGFGEFVPGSTSRAAIRILSHINDLYDWALTMAQGQPRWADSVPGPWDAEVDRFYAGLAALDACLEEKTALGTTPETLLAGPIADSLTHIGQLAMLRRLAGAPVRGENYARAEIVMGRLGPNQSPPRREFD